MEMTYNVKSEGQRIFDCIMGLHDAGLSMNDIQDMLPELLAAKEQKLQDSGDYQYNTYEHNYLSNGYQDQEYNTMYQDTDPVYMAIVMERVLQNNNVLLEQGICDMVTESIKSELSHLFVARDQMEEERFKRLDTLIRQQQVYRKESGKRNSSFFMRELLGFS